MEASQQCFVTWKDDDEGNEYRLDNDVPTTNQRLFFTQASYMSIDEQPSLKKQESLTKMQEFLNILQHEQPVEIEPCFGERSTLKNQLSK